METGRARELLPLTTNIFELITGDRLPANKVSNNLVFGRIISVQDHNFSGGDRHLQSLVNQPESCDRELLPLTTNIGVVDYRRSLASR
ncbi:MAG: hypothetical protein QNJ72_27445 [Pleurocapsa sp. MO_226.B13]|nr:hypothetical protein [Pleurocapsa sp. MO_226.B13]